MKVKKGEKLFTLCFICFALCCLIGWLLFTCVTCCIVMLHIAWLLLHVRSSLKRGRNFKNWRYLRNLICLTVHLNHLLGCFVIHYLDYYCWLFVLKNKVYHNYLVNVWLYVHSYWLIFLFMTFDHHDFNVKTLIWWYDATI